jgi:hypothetical protein
MAGDWGCRLRSGWWRALGLGIGLFMVFAASAGPAWASCANQVYDEALPVSSSSPLDGASYSPTSNRVGWEVVTMHGLEALDVRVDTQATLGNDGTLSTLNEVDDFGLGESNTYGHYTGASNGGANWWPNRPGQYYWQAFGIGESTDPNTGILTCHLYAGPVYTITVAALQPQGPTPITGDDMLRATLNSFGPKIAKDENAIKKGLKGYPKGKFRPLTRALQHEVGDLQAVTSRLSHESASSASGAQAKTEIIKGLGLIASAYAALRKDVLTAHGGTVPAAKVTSAVNTDKEGRKTFQAGLKLLDAQPTPNPTPTPTSTPTGCYPLASSGNCYEPGEYCPNADRGMSGVAGNGEAIICEYNNGWRWEPA